MEVGVIWAEPLEKDILSQSLLGDMASMGILQGTRFGSVRGQRRGEDEQLHVMLNNDCPKEAACMPGQSPNPPSLRP